MTFSRAGYIKCEPKWVGCQWILASGSWFPRMVFSDTYISEYIDVNRQVLATFPPPPPHSILLHKILKSEIWQYLATLGLVNGNLVWCSHLSKIYIIANNVFHSKSSVHLFFLSPSVYHLMFSLSTCCIRSPFVFILGQVRHQSQPRQTVRWSTIIPGPIWHHPYLSRIITYREYIECYRCHCYKADTRLIKTVIYASRLR